MQEIVNGPLRYYQFASFDPAHVSHAVFTRHGGVSPEPYDSLNMSVSTGDARHNVEENRTRAFRALERRPESVADLWQVHSADVVVADEANGPRGCLGKADALITNRPDVTLFLRFADCVPIVLHDPRRQVVGLVHAGWRGTLLKAAAAAVDAMTETYGSAPSDILAGIGPSIGPCHYAVGPEVVLKTREAFPNAADDLLAGRDGVVHLDLWAANELTLRLAGVEHIESAAMCTACHSDEFFSHRGEQTRTGRFAALVGLSLGH
jgi:polyphenol oxidase